MNRLREQAARLVTSFLIRSLARINPKATYRVGPDGASALFEGRWYRYNPDEYGCTGNIDYVTEAENATRQHLFGLLKAGQTVFDIGAHGGVYMISLIDHGATVHSFEPQPEELLANLALNGLSSDRVHAVALGDKPGTVKMTTKERSSNHISEHGDRSVTLARLDEIALPDPHWIKIDIEGMELPALKGAEQLLRRSHPTIICEINHISGRYGTRVEDLTGYLGSLGYEIHALRDGKLVPIKGNELPASADNNYWFK